MGHYILSVPTVCRVAERKVVHDRRILAQVVAVTLAHNRVAVVVLTSVAVRT